MQAAGLQLAPQKSEAIMLTSKWAFRTPEIQVNGHMIPFRRSIRYLGVEFDRRLNFSRHVAKVVGSASAMTITRLMPNVGGPNSSKRLLLASVAHSKLLNAAPVWALDGVKTAKNRNLTMLCQRKVALRIIRSYRTVSDEAALFLARKAVVGREKSLTLIKNSERAHMLRKWQER